MSKDNVGEIAAEYFKSGFNCAESVLLANSKANQNDSDALIPSMASFFGGGVGSTHQEICGAISGAVIALGLLLGRNVPGKDIDEQKIIVSTILKKFEHKFSTTNCGKLIYGLDDESRTNKCTSIVKETAMLLDEELRNKKELL